METKFDICYDISTVLPNSWIQPRVSECDSICVYWSIVQLLDSSIFFFTWSYCFHLRLSSEVPQTALFFEREKPQTAHAQIFFAWPLFMSPARQSNKKPIKQPTPPARRPAYCVQTAHHLTVLVPPRQPRNDSTSLNTQLHLPYRRTQ
jgi:hypothetical protein